MLSLFIGKYPAEVKIFKFPAGESGDWGIIACIIENHSHNFQPVVYIKED